MEEKFIAYDIGKIIEVLKPTCTNEDKKNGSLSATYNGKGKLVSSGKNI
jgi:hypothetical protein